MLIQTIELLLYRIVYIFFRIIFIMKQKYVALVAVLIATMFIMIAYSSANTNYINNINDAKSNNNIPVSYI
ncbi:hypothetical protein FACI_IFERC00001G0753 [Ferroplasma acidarmanus Fer1]|uniref:Uncharacterized protein n=1 Tax=Ferroplasma acidarmanus Fer1 TaxID=333146 RepID=S0AN81_FERAC|nr:hypothetical protein FACI_IFERC00001G0753 [Ferroplasma acidarmanus Fer1]